MSRLWSSGYASRRRPRATPPVANQVGEHGKLARSQAVRSERGLEAPRQHVSYEKTG